MVRRAGTRLAVASGFAMLIATGCWTVNLADGADPRWAVATWLLLIPVALAESILRSRISGLIIGILGIATAVGAAWLGDRAGVTWWWLAMAGGWWAVLAGGDWRARPGLAVLNGLLAAAAVVAAIVVVLAIAEPALSVAGLWTALVVPWCGWRGVGYLTAARRGARGPGRTGHLGVP